MNPKDSKKNIQPVFKPFVTGSITDENTWRNALKFMGLMIITAFMSFLVCSMTGFQSSVLRIIVNAAIETVILFLFFNRAAGYGEEAVARGEILFQHREKGIEITENEKRIPFHPMKGFVTGLIGTVIFLIPAIVLAVTATRQMTGAGTLPSWMDSYTRRSEIGGALVAYTNPEGLGFMDYIRMFVRICLMPFISMCGAENKDGLLLIEKLGPVLMLLPAISYGIGYLQGKKMRIRVHTEIAENAKKRRKREIKARKARVAPRRPQGPTQLN